MLTDRLAQDLYAEICHIPLIDCHSHIDPRRPTARRLHEILGYHYYTELAHSAGMERGRSRPEIDPRDWVREILYHTTRFDNTAQYQWLVEIARAFLNFQGYQIGIADCTWLCDTAERLMASPDWEGNLLRQSNLEKIFLTNEFDDPLNTGTAEPFDSSRYVPCLRLDSVVFGLGDPAVRLRLAKTAAIEIGDSATLRQALVVLFEKFIRSGARACAISLPPNFAPGPVSDAEMSKSLGARGDMSAVSASDRVRSPGIFWMAVELCRSFKLPFQLMIGVNRRVYEQGVPQGQDLFDQRTSLIQYAQMLNAFPEVPFCISVLSSNQNQELVSYSWIFPNVITSGHWWYSNIPVYIEPDLRARLQAVPKTKQIGYYSDMYKLEFALPKFNMYRRILAQVLADDFVRPRIYTEIQAVELARFLLRDNARRIFNV
jgi:glucuronate isomerase